MKHLTALALIVFVLGGQTAYSADTCRALFEARRKSDVELKDRVDQVEEHQLRKGDVAAHVYLDSTIDPYLYFAFPAGNSGVALWFKADGRASLKSTSVARAIRAENGLRGAEIEISSGTRRLSIDDSVLGSMRFIRDRELGIATPIEVKDQDTKLVDGKLVIERSSLNRLAAYRIELEPLAGTRIVSINGKLELVSSGDVRFRARGLSSEKPLTPLAPSDVFKPEALAKMSPKQVEAFSFLMTKEKLMAGSPRYLSKFGRDSLITLHVLMDAMKPEAIESLLKATLSSSHPTKGIISHEQSEGDFASYERLKKREKTEGVTTPLEEFKMIDADFIFTIVMSGYLDRYPERSQAFLSGRDSRGLPLRQLVKNNFQHTIRSASPFARNPEFKNLIRLHEGETVGQWRDSDNGLGGGAYPFDVNAALVPGALAAMRDALAKPGTELYDPAGAARLAKMFDVWSEKVVPLFEVRVPQQEVASIGASYLRSLGIDPSALPAAPKGELVFSGIALDDAGRPVRIMHSDDSMMMTFGSPNQDFLRAAASRIEREFPYGLGTPVGILVANPAFASLDLQKNFDETKYHGRVSWTMQEHLLELGLKRAMKDASLPPGLVAQLAQAKDKVHAVIAAKSAFGGTEVFALKFEHGRFKPVPFAGDAKSNSNQLWSHLSLIEVDPRPAPAPSTRAKK